MLRGKQTWMFNQKPRILATATVVGPDEGLGPLANTFDEVNLDARLQQPSWEQAERAMAERACELALMKAGKKNQDIDFMAGGDLMNQIITSSFAARTLAIPYVGMFGACSTSMLTLATAAQWVDAGMAKHALAVTSSHNSTAEKQFRYPTEYGSQKPPTAQFTVTGAGAAIVAAGGPGIRITAATIGKVIDMGITDPFNMGAAMAPAAVDTIKTHLHDLNRTPADYDMILTGDLATVGKAIAKALMAQQNIPIEQTTYDDCGMLIYNFQTQPDIMAGGSGCACSAVVTFGHLFQLLNSGQPKRILVVATGALLSPLSFQQGESIPGIAHAVCFESEGYA
jgi:stage V sporulation protein AD